MAVFDKVVLGIFGARKKRGRQVAKVGESVGGGALWFRELYLTDRTTRATHCLLFDPNGFQNPGAERLFGFPFRALGWVLGLDVDAFG